MARRATIIAEERGGDKRILLVSAGDFSGDPGILGMYRSRFLAHTMIELGYDAVAVGERDLSFGLRPLREYAEAGLPLICANLYEGGERVFPPSIVASVHGKRIGIIALLGETPREIDGLEIRDPLTEARGALNELREKADCVILLAHMARDRLSTLLPELAGIDFVIRGHTVVVEDARDDCADTTGGAFEDALVPILFAGDRARSIGRAVICRWERGNPVIAERELVRLDASVPDDAASAERLRTFFAEEGLRRRKLSLSQSLARDGKTGTIVERYLGVHICARCHEDLMPRFTLSRHFRAMETLRARSEDANPSCLPCHTTGYGRPTGYSPGAEAAGAPYLRGVQCEACHGPGTTHDRSGSLAAAARTSCRTCHTAQWSPDFDYETYWRRAAHCGALADSLSAGAP